MRKWFLLVCLFVVSLPAVTTRIYSSDEIQYFAYLRSLWFDRDLSFENEYQYFYERNIARSDGFHETFLERETATGRRINFATIGCAILWAPFYAVGDVVARTGGGPADGYSKPYVAAVAYGSALYGFLALVLSILSARRLGLDGFAAGIAVWLGTPLLFYMYLAPPFSHACSAFGVALFIYAWLRVRERWSPRGLAALGAAAALMTMIREQDAFFVAGPALDYAWALLASMRGARSEGRGAEVGGRRSEVGGRRSAVGGRRSAVGDRRSEIGGRRAEVGSWAGLVAGIASFAAVFTPQALSYLVLNGRLGPHASVGHKMNWAAPHALQVLFSPEHGFFVWTPLALVALLGFLVPPEGGSYPERRGFSRIVAICLLLMAALQVYVGGSVESWTVAGAFGQRRFIALTAVLVIGLSRLIAGLPRPGRVGRAGAALALGLLVYWNLALIAEFATCLMDRQRLEPRRNAYDAFVTLPARAPSLAYRYLFDRGSFYRGCEARGAGEGR